MSGKLSFKEAVALWARQRERPIQEHPSLPTLLSYHRRQLGEEAMEELRDHIADCTECSKTLLEFSQSEAESRQSPLVTPNQLNNAWERFQPRLAKEGILAPPQGIPQEESLAVGPRTGVETASEERLIQGSEMASRLRPPQRLWLHRASLVLVALWPFMLGWLVYVKQENARLSSLQMISGVDDFQLVEEGSRGSEPARIRLTGSSDGARILVLGYQKEKSYPQYQIAILKAGGEATVWRSPNLDEPESGDFVVYLPPGALASGRYVLRLHGFENGQWTLLSENGLQVD